MNVIKIFFLFCIITIVSCESNKFTTADGKVLEVSSLVGMNVFEIASDYSTTSPETLIGTNEERWVVYYDDIDVTLETKKATNIIQKAKKGRKPKDCTCSK